MKAYATIYTHRYGTDVEIFSTRELAEVYRNEVARDNWNDEIPDKPMPDMNVGDSYFDIIHDEFFDIVECVLDSK